MWLRVVRNSEPHYARASCILILTRRIVEHGKSLIEPQAELLRTTRNSIRPETSICIMRSLILCAVTLAVLVAEVRAVPTVTPSECVRKKTEEGIELVRSSITSSVDELVRGGKNQPQMRSFSAAVRGILDDIALASREMMKSSSAGELEVNKRNAAMILDSRSRTWTAKIDESFKNSPDTFETRKTKAADVFAIFVELGYQTLLAIQEEAKVCF